jgi:hypothetical protein
MADRRQLHPAPALPPLRSTRIAAAHGVAATLAPDTARLTRLAVSLVALALPALGIACADMVPRAGAPGAQQAAAPLTPSRGAAAAAGLLRSSIPVREASLSLGSEARP